MTKIDLENPSKSQVVHTSLILGHRIHQMTVRDEAQTPRSRIREGTDDLDLRDWDVLVGWVCWCWDAAACMRRVQLSSLETDLLL